MRRPRRAHVYTHTYPASEAQQWKWTYVSYVQRVRVICGLCESLLVCASVYASCVWGGQGFLFFFPVASAVSGQSGEPSVSQERERERERKFGNEHLFAGQAVEPVARSFFACRWLFFFSRSYCGRSEGASKERGPWSRYTLAAYTYMM